MTNPMVAARQANSVTLYVMLTRHFANGVGYDTQTQEMSLTCSAEGYVWNTESKFESKRCRVSFRHDTSNAQEGFAREHGMQAVCGSIEIAAFVSAEIFYDDGLQVTLPPIEIALVLNEITYARLEALLRSALSGGQAASMSLCFTHREFTTPFICLDDIDVSTKTIYPVISFCVNQTRQENKKVYVPKHDQDAGVRAGLRFVASFAEVDSTVWHSELILYGLKLSGKISCQELGIKSADSDLEIREFEESGGRQNGYAEESFPGSVAISKIESDAYCSVALYATQETLTQISKMVLSMSHGDSVRFDVAFLVVGHSSISGERCFNVTGFSPVLVKSFS